MTEKAFSKRPPRSFPLRRWSLVLLCALLAVSAVGAAPARSPRSGARSVAAGKVNSITNAVNWKKAKATGPALTVYRHDYREPRQMHVSAVRIDLKAKGLRFAGTHRDPKWGEKMPDSDQYLIRTKRTTTEDFLLDEYKQGRKLICAFNTTPWVPWDNVDHVYAHPLGINLDGTNVISGTAGGEAQMFIVWKDGHCSIDSRLAGSDVEKVQMVHSGFSIIMKGGANNQNAADQECHPRTVLGLSSDGRYLYVMAVDGRQQGWSEGATVWECAELMRAMGAADAINMDGGGSTTLIVGKGKRVEYLNRHNAKGTGWRRNAMNMGVYLK